MPESRTRKPASASSPRRGTGFRHAQRACAYHLRRHEVRALHPTRPSPSRSPGDQTRSRAPANLLAATPGELPSARHRRRRRRSSLRSPRRRTSLPAACSSGRRGGVRPRALGTSRSSTTRSRHRPRRPLRPGSRSDGDRDPPRTRRREDPCQDPRQGYGELLVQREEERLHEIGPISRSGTPRDACFQPTHADLHRCDGLNLALLSIPARSSMSCPTPDPNRSSRRSPVPATVTPHAEGVGVALPAGEVGTNADQLLPPIWM